MLVVGSFLPANRRRPRSRLPVLDPCWRGRGDLGKEARLISDENNPRGPRIALSLFAHRMWLQSPVQSKKSNFYTGVPSRISAPSASQRRTSPLWDRRGKAARFNCLGGRAEKNVKPPEENNLDLQAIRFDQRRFQAEGVRSQSWGAQPTPAAGGPFDSQCHRGASPPCHFTGQVPALVPGRIAQRGD